MSHLQSFTGSLRVAVIGASGGIGTALTQLLEKDNKVGKIYLLGRSQPETIPAKAEFLCLDLTDETTIQHAARAIKASGLLDIVVITTGFLHDAHHQPEKSFKHITLKALEKSFALNTFGPVLVGKHFLPLLRRDRKTVFAALSARVGSISDNRLGGWYAYRASKAALNMLLKCFAIEFGRTSKNMIILGMHPGTVDTELSEPFQANVPEGKLFSPDYSATRLLTVIDSATPVVSGNLISWEGEKIPF